MLHTNIIICYRTSCADPYFVFQEGEAVDDDGWTDVTDQLYKKGAKYLATHDFEATVPSFLGGGPGARVRLSPKKILPDGGIILRMDVLPAARDARSPRFMHKMISKQRVRL